MFKPTPALSVCLLLATLPATAANIYVKAGESLQVALNIALPGDVITLQAGATFTGNFTLPAKSGSGTIRIESSDMANLPNARITPSDAVHMPKIVTATGSPALTAAPGAHDYVLAGLEITAAPGVYTIGMLQIGWGTEAALSQIPYNFTVERCFVHGDPTVGGKRGIAINSRSTIVRQSWVSDFKSTYQDTQAVGGYNGPGPFQILDNHLEATGENIMFGGAKPALVNAVPSDITIRGNTIRKPLSWKMGTPTYEGTNWLVKNHFELKSGRRVVFDGNILENCWQSGQNGTSIVLTVSTEGGGAPWAAVEDVTISNNIIRHVGVGVTGHAKDANGGVTRNLRFKNNLFEDIDDTKWGGFGAFMVMTGNVPGLVIEHNTLLASKHTLRFSYNVSQGTVLRNNIVTGPICADALGCGVSYINALGPAAIIAGNVMARVTPTGLPLTNFFPADVDNIRFKDPNNSDYALAFDSLYVRKATDGTDPGVDMAALQNALNSASSVDPTPAPGNPLPPPPAPAPPVSTVPGKATFVRIDNTTAGSWKGVYGGEGFNTLHEVRYPAYVTAAVSGVSMWNWSSATTEARGLQKSSPTSYDRVAACWHAEAFTIDLSFNDANTHRVALYFLDWDRRGRVEKIEVLDSSNNVLDTRSASGFAGGQYVVWNLSGRVKIRVTKTAGINAVISGLFFDDATAAPTSTVGGASFVRVDTATAGSWKGVYGADGYNVINNSVVYPSFASVTPSGFSAWTWATSTADARALQSGSSTVNTRTLTAWHSETSFQINLAFSDLNPHQVAIYMVDWDRQNRSQRVEILDANERVLDSRSVSNFSGGQYLVWNLTGRVTIRVTNAGARNAVISGLFFR
jgi:hypothetical protein